MDEQGNWYDAQGNLIDQNTGNDPMHNARTLEYVPGRDDAPPIDLLYRPGEDSGTGMPMDTNGGKGDSGDTSTTSPPNTHKPAMNEYGRWTYPDGSPAPDPDHNPHILKASGSRVNVDRSSPQNGETPSSPDASNDDPIPEGVKGDMAALAREGVEADRVRRSYQERIKQASDEILEKYRQGGYSAEEAARLASGERNKIMMEAREQGTETAKAIAEMKKKEGIAFDDLLDRYAGEKKNFKDLTPKEQMAVWEKIINKSGSGNSDWTRRARIAGKAGRGLWLLTAAIAANNIMVAQDKKHAALKEGVTVTGGAVGGAAGGLLGTLCGPGAFICSPLGVMIGGYLGGEGGANLVEGTYGHEGGEIDSDWVMP
ncbi:hypothetical protein [Magnetospira sp. QH-2]|uniref:hypothetical protein n=1 Tax=Magnetospira sp. (strain QH-2) TaxID=1288970 RepID=UPI00130E2A77|nr:hypothetical protein [Magnetospira sp. QH-2]